MSAGEGELGVTIDRLGSAAILRLSGELDIAGVPLVKQALDGLRTPYACIILDVSGLSFMDSTGINLAVAEYHRSQADGFDFAIAGARGEVLRVLQLSGLDVTLPCAPDVESALPTSDDFLPSLLQRTQRTP